MAQLPYIFSPPYTLPLSIFKNCLGIRVEHIRELSLLKVALYICFYRCRQSQRLTFLILLLSFNRSQQKSRISSSLISFEFFWVKAGSILLAFNSIVNARSEKSALECHPILKWAGKYYAIELVITHPTTITF